MSLIRLKNLSIQTKQMFILMLTAGAALLLAYIGFVAYELTDVRAGMEVEMERLAKQIGWANSAELLFGNASSATNNMVNLLRSDPAIVAACIYDTNGDVFARYPNDKAVVPAHQPPEALRFGKDYLALSRQ